MDLADRIFTGLIGKAKRRVELVGKEQRERTKLLNRNFD